MKTSLKTKSMKDFGRRVNENFKKYHFSKQNKDDDKKIIKAKVSEQKKYLYLVIDEQLKGLIDLVVDVLRLHFFCDKLRDDGVYPKV